MTGYFLASIYSILGLGISVCLLVSLILLIRLLTRLIRYFNHKLSHLEP